MVRIDGTFDLEDKKEKKERNKWKDFGEFLEDSWWGLLIGAWIMSILIGSIADAVKDPLPAVFEQAVVIEYNPKNTYKYKIKFLNGGDVRMESLTTGISVGDTIKIER